MKAMVLEKQAKIESSPLKEKDVEKPDINDHELLVKVKVCGICRTDLHIIEGDLPPQTLPMIPGHEIVGIVEKLGKKVKRFSRGDRIGIAWLRHTCQKCSFCLEGKENLCEKSLYTGYHRFGGYAEYTKIDEAYAYKIPSIFQDVEAAPLLCAGIIGYRSYKKANLPKKGKLGMIGFGSSAHITIQIALHQGHEVYVSSRDLKHQKLSKQLGAKWVGGSNDDFPELLDGIIVFAPVGVVVPMALKSLKKGGTVSLAGISMTDIPSLNYQAHLFHEKTLQSVEANTREDGEEFFKIAAELPIKPKTEIYPLNQANLALQNLKEDKIQGTAVLQVSSEL